MFKGIYMINCNENETEKYINKRSDIDITCLDVDITCLSKLIPICMK